MARALVGEYQLCSWQHRIGWLPRNAFYDRLTALILLDHLAQDAVCIDVGAFQGEITRQMLDAAPAGRVLAFEPLPDQAAALRQRFADYPVEVLELALSDRAGPSAFNQVLSNPAYSGLIRRAYDRAHERDRQIQVHTARLDDLLAERALQRIDLIKIDVEGGEYGALSGALETIRRHRPLILFEYGRGASDHYGVSPEQMWAMLEEECAMQIYLLPNWLRRRRPMTRAAFIANFQSGPDYFFVAAPGKRPTPPGTTGSEMV